MEILSNAEIKIIVSFLDELGDYFSTAGCNDYFFPREMTAGEIEEITNHFDEEPDLVNQDWAVLNLMIEKLNKMRN